MFEFVDDLTREELDEWILGMGASVEYLGDGVWAVMQAATTSNYAAVSGVDKVRVMYENSVVDSAV